MKLCQKCDQPLAEEVNTCPSCGSEVAEGRQYIDDYRIVTVLHEGYASFLCKAIRERTDEKVMIRLFTSQSGVDEKVAERLRRELEELKKLPPKGFVQHYAIRRSSDGLWYRISEWVDAVNWGDLMRSGRLKDYQFTFDLFVKIADGLQVLHEYGHIIPHLILDDIMAIEGENGDLEVKIDYKFSRFFDPKLDRPGPMLKHLIGCHPEIMNQNPLDHRSDIWSLGKIFLELLTADIEICEHKAKVDELPLPEDAKVLIKTMLADDPALRPGSMKEVADALSRITDADIEEAKLEQIQIRETSASTVQRIKKRQSFIIAVVVMLILAGFGLSFYNFGIQKKDDTVILEDFANQYADSIAFILVDYWLRDNQAFVYRNRAEGIGFLVDRDGYILTNRHVACPWLEDTSLLIAIAQLRQLGRSPSFGYRIFLWFEGEKAFNRSAGLIESPDLTDAYFLDSAYRSDGTPSLTIAGVAKPLVRTRQLVSSPLRDDFAVLKIENIPRGLKPLPLSEQLDPLKIPKLSPVIAIGFPLGSRTQEMTINVSVARGHVRRSFENLIQIDASIYGGNSGGPLIDIQGKVVGIVSGVATDRAQGMIPMVTPLWDLGMVLPIAKASSFLKELKEGQIKWNGVFDLSLEDKLNNIFAAADQGRWAEAMAVADKGLESGSDPQLLLTAGMTHLFTEDSIGAKQIFQKALSMEPENSLAKLMLFVLDWLESDASKSRHYQDLKMLDWRSPAEFHGYLARVLTGEVDPVAAIEGWDTPGEKSWLYYIFGMVNFKQENKAAAERFLKKSIISGAPRTWPYYLSRARLDRLQQTRLTRLREDPRWHEYEKEIETFAAAVEKANAEKKLRKEKLAGAETIHQSETAGVEAKIEALEKILEKSPEDGDAYVGLVFYHAVVENWEKAITYAGRFLKRKGRESARRLSVGLLEPLLIYRSGQKEAAQNRLATILKKMQDPWYRAICEGLLGRRTLDDLKNEVGNSPENLITLHTAFGFWSEGAGEKEKAIEHYKKALESFLDTWVEFEFIKGRLNRLRKPAA